MPDTKNIKQQMNMSLNRFYFHIIINFFEQYRIIPFVPFGIRRDFTVFWRSGKLVGRELNEKFFGKSKIIFN